MIAAGVAPPALEALQSFPALAPSLPTPSLAVGPRAKAGQSKRTANDAGWEE